MVFAHVHKPDISHLYDRLDEVKAYIDEDDLLTDVLTAAVELISNAARHSEGAEIELKIDVDESGVTIEVFDYGYGFVPPPILSKQDAQARLDAMPWEQTEGRGLLTCMARADEVVFDESVVFLKFNWRQPIP